MYLPIPWGIHSHPYICSYTSIGTTLIITKNVIVNQNTKIYPFNNQTAKNNEQYYYVTLNFFLLTIKLMSHKMYSHSLFYNN